MIDSEIRSLVQIIHKLKKKGYSVDFNIFSKKFDKEKIPENFIKVREQDYANIWKSEEVEISFFQFLNEKDIKKRKIERLKKQLSEI